MASPGDAGEEKRRKKGTIQCNDTTLSYMNYRTPVSGSEESKKTIPNEI